jgi:hypothetical protein
MLNLNLNIIGAGGKSRIGAGPQIGPTTTTTTTTTSTTTTTTTTTTAGPISLRTDPYSASLVYAVPGAQFGSTYGQESFRSDISSYIRGTGTSFTDAELPLTSSGVPFGKGTFTASLESVALWSGYPSAIEISGSNGSGSLCIEAPPNSSQFEFLSQDFTIETYINYQNSSSIYSPNQGPGNVNAAMYWQYAENPIPGFGFNTNGIANQDPGVRFLIFASNGSSIYYDSNVLPRQANQWYHFGCQREGSTFTSLWSGSAVQSFVFAGNLGTGSLNTPFYIMGTGYDAVKCHRYQDYRIYNGAAKYSGITSGSTYTQPLSMVIA